MHILKVYLLWRRAKIRERLIEKFVDQISSHGCIDGIKRKELEKACKKIHKVLTRMVAVRIVRVFNVYVNTASIQYTVSRGSTNGCAVTTRATSCKHTGACPHTCHFQGR